MFIATLLYKQVNKNAPGPKFPCLTQHKNQNISYLRTEMIAIQFYSTASCRIYKQEQHSNLRLYKQLFNELELLSETSYTCNQHSKKVIYLKKTSLFSSYFFLEKEGVPKFQPMTN